MEVEAISRPETEDDGLRVPIEDHYKFLYDVLTDGRDGWMALPESMAVARTVAAANQVALVG